MYDNLCGSFVKRLINNIFKNKSRYVAINNYFLLNNIFFRIKIKYYFDEMNQSAINDFIVYLFVQFRWFIPINIRKQKWLVYLVI